MRLPFSISTVLKAFIVSAYALACTLVLTPRLDYSGWYPDFIQRYDLNTGLEFNDHKIATFTSKKNEDEVIRTVLNRAKAAEITDMLVEKDPAKLNFRFSADYPQSLIDMLFTRGVIRFMTVTDQTMVDMFPEAGQQIGNYTETDFKHNYIESARVENIDGFYVTIEIETSNDNVLKLVDAVADDPNRQIGLAIDDQVTTTFVLLPDGQQRQNPGLVVISSEQEAKLLAHLLQTPGLEEGFPPFFNNISEPLFDSKYLLYIFVILAAVTTTGMLYRAIFMKEKISRLAMTAAMLIGILTVMKMVPITYTLMTLLTVILAMGILTVADSNRLPILSISLVLLGGILNQAGPAVLFGPGQVLFVSGGCTLAFYFIYYFAGLYERK